MRKSWAFQELPSHFLSVGQVGSLPLFLHKEKNFNNPITNHSGHLRTKAAESMFGLPNDADICHFIFSLEEGQPALGTIIIPL